MTNLNLTYCSVLYGLGILDRLGYSLGILNRLLSVLHWSGSILHSGWLNLQRNKKPFFCTIKKLSASLSNSSIAIQKRNKILTATASFVILVSVFLTVENALSTAWNTKQGCWNIPMLTWNVIVCFWNATHFSLMGNWGSACKTAHSVWATLSHSWIQVLDLRADNSSLGNAKKRKKDSNSLRGNKRQIWQLETLCKPGFTVIKTTCFCTSLLEIFIWTVFL